MSGCDPSVVPNPDLFVPADLWDRVYITTLFTFHFREVIDTIRFYVEAAGGTASKVYVGGIMASLMPEAVYEETGIYPVRGVLSSPEQIGLSGDTNIDLLPPDYDLLNSAWYAVNDTYYGYTTRGCVNACPWCGVSAIEPSFIDYIDIKPMIREMRSRYGDKAGLRLMDNNVLASPKLANIVDDLLDLGYGREQYTDARPKRQRFVDFNQGLDATYVTDETMELLAQLNVNPMRIAFDRVSDREVYTRAVETAVKAGVTAFSTYMLFNFRDAPRDLYERLRINIDLNRRWAGGDQGRVAGPVSSYPMRYAPIDDKTGDGVSKQRDALPASAREDHDWLHDPVWTPRFVRSIEIMKGAAHGSISQTPSLAIRTIGETFEEFLTNLYMPEELLRNRNKHEKRVYDYEPPRPPGTGLVEAFRGFMLGLLKRQDTRFQLFHDAVAPNSTRSIRIGLESIDDEELRKWLMFYLKTP